MLLNGKTKQLLPRAKSSQQDFNEQHHNEDDEEGELESRDEANIDDDSKPNTPRFQSIVSNIDARVLRLMRQSLLGENGQSPPPSASSSRRSRHIFIFEPPREELKLLISFSPLFIHSQNHSWITIGKGGWGHMTGHSLNSLVLFRLIV